jgi:hypothetical protein
MIVWSRTLPAVARAALEWRRAMLRCRMRRIVVRRAAVIPARVIAVILTVTAPPMMQACTRVHTPGGPTAARLLASGEYHWVREDSGGIRLYATDGSVAATNRTAIALAAARALSNSISLLHGSWPNPSVSVFCFSSPEELQRIAARRTNGIVQPGEDTILLVYDGRRPPVLRHEMTHVVVNHLWGASSQDADWLAEGIAMWSVGGCQHNSLHQLAAGLQHEGPIPPLDQFVAQFRRLDEATAFIVSGSITAFIVERHGIARVQELWRTSGQSGHPLGIDGERMEREWREMLRSTEPRYLDVSQAETAGCEEAIP